MAASATATSKALQPVAPAGRLSAPPGPPGPPFVHGLTMLGAEQRLLARCQRRYGDVFTLKIPWPFKRLVVVADPAEIKRIFTADPTLIHAGEGNVVLEPLVGLNSVLLLDEADHMQQRKLMLPSFHGERMRVYGDLMREVTEEQIAWWPLGEPFALHPSMQAITLRIICRAVFGVTDGARLRALETSLLEMLQKGVRLIMVRGLQRDLGPRSPWGSFLASRKRTDELIFDEIRKRRDAPDLAERSDVLSLLLQARDDDGQGMTDVQLRDELVTLLVAGHETTASQLAWTFERLMRTPDVFARLRRSLDEGNEDYLDCVIKESQRTRPVLTYSALRKLTAPAEVGGYTVPAGWTLGASAWLVQHRPDLYPDPQVFRPERFEEGSPSGYAWVPFGGGVRRCLGAAFATYEMRTVLRTIVERFELEAPDPKPERMARRAITFVPAKGARAVLRAR